MYQGIIIQKREKAMLKKSLFSFAIGVALIISMGSAYAYEALHGPTELIYYNKENAYNGYTLFAPFEGNIHYSFLIDMEGNVCHEWNLGNARPEKHSRLLEDGHLIWAIKAGRERVKYQELDWDGNVLWTVQDNREGYGSHHDFRKIWNKKLNAHTVLVVSTKRVTHEEAIARGCDPKLRSNYTSAPDGLVELDLKGNVVWEWNVFDHLIQDVDPTKENYVGKGKTIADYPQKMDANFGGGRAGDWIHTNSLDYNSTLDHIVTNNSSNSEFYVIDHGATFVAGDPEKSIELAASDAGDFLYRWGNPAVYDSGDSPSIQSEGQRSDNGHKQAFFTHDIQWIRDGLPGAGNFLIFDNGEKRPGETYSSIIEINPYKGAMQNGVYVSEVEAGYSRPKGGKGPAPLRSNQIVWSYKSKSTQSFYSGHISGAQRLPNGNTLICSGRWGHFFEVTAKGECVWEYINPVTKGGIKTFIDDQPRGYMDVFRCLRYGVDYPGLAGRDLTPKGPITKIHASDSRRSSSKSGKSDNRRAPK